MEGSFTCTRPVAIFSQDDQVFFLVSRSSAQIQQKSSAQISEYSDIRIFCADDFCCIRIFVQMCTNFHKYFEYLTAQMFKICADDRIFDHLPIFSNIRDLLLYLCR